MKKLRKRHPIPQTFSNSKKKHKRKPRKPPPLLCKMCEVGYHQDLALEMEKECQRCGTPPEVFATGVVFCKQCNTTTNKCPSHKCGRRYPIADKFDTSASCPKCGKGGSAGGNKYIEREQQGKKEKKSQGRFHTTRKLVRELAHK